MSDKVRVYEVAEESGATSSEVILKAKDLNIVLKSPQSQISFEDAEEITNYIMTGKSSRIIDVEKNSTKDEIDKSNLKKSQDISNVKLEEENIVVQSDILEDKIDVQSSIFNKNDISLEKELIISGEQNQTKIIPKRRGLKIVKKKIVASKSKVEESENINKDNISKNKMKSLSEILGSINTVNGISKEEHKKSIKKKSLVKAHDHGKVLNVSSDIDFKKSDDSILGEEVVLLDMSMTDKIKTFDEYKKVKSIRTTNQSAFGNRPQGLRRRKIKKKAKKELTVDNITSIKIPEDVRVYEFAQACGKSPSEVITVLFGLGMLVTKNDFLKQDELEILGEEFGIEVNVKDALEEANYIEDYNSNDNINNNLITKPPVVTIMGHVDHGKTSLLDKIRSSNIASSEAGGITQHVSAYTIEKNSQKITFVDTPGHEAFSQMRLRGASITDIIIIVVAGDDGVKPQTIEAIKHAKLSKSPIIVAINKIDKETCNIDRVKTQMSEHDVNCIEWGGDVEFIGVSAKSGEGIDSLLENILLQAEVLELKGDSTIKAKSVVLESSVEKGRGPIATVIIQNGTLKIGDNIVCDTTYGRVKAITNDNGKVVKELGLSETGRVLGLNEVPSTGSVLVVQDSEKEAKDIANTRAEHERSKELSKSTKVTLEEMSGLIAEGKINSLPIIIKADAGGSLEAIKGSLEKIKNEEVKVKIIYSGIGGITQSDLALANASDDCIILGFNVRPTGLVKQEAKTKGIVINTYTIIYDLIADVKAILSGMMSDIISEENTGQAEVKNTFVVPKIGTVAGCTVNDGKVIVGGLARIIRDGVVIYTGKISSLKRFKDDVKEVSNGYECGIMLEKFHNIEVGDFIETFIQTKEQQSMV
jgi:translation initiation factor IF-2